MDDQLGKAQASIDSRRSRKVHDERELYVVVFKEEETPKFVVQMQFRTWYCTVLHLNENRREKIVETYAEMYDVYGKKGVGIPKGIENQIFSGIEKKNTSIRKIGYRFRNEWKYTKVYHSWAESIRKLIKTSNGWTS